MEAHGRSVDEGVWYRLSWLLAASGWSGEAGWTGQPPELAVGRKKLRRDVTGSVADMHLLRSLRVIPLVVGGST